MKHINGAQSSIFKKKVKYNMTVVITGASSGIGKETAMAFLKNGDKVYCLSRRPCDLNGIINIKCDITDENQVESAFEEIETIDLLINNAGFGISGAVEYTELSEMKSQFELNFFAQICVTQCALQKLKQSKGKIIFVSSAASVFSIPFQSFYSATKASIESLTAALRNELKMFDVQVGCVRLGDIKTGFTAAREKSFKGDEAYNGMISRSVSVMEKDETNGMPPSAVAKTILKISSKKKLPLVTTVGAQYKFLCFLSKILPSAIVNKLVASIYMPKK